MDNQKKDFWKRKLMAYLHDPPHKPLNFGPIHEESAWQICKGAGMTDEDYEIFKKIKDADHTAAASDRFPFPKVKCSNVFTGKVGETFKHPLSGIEYELKCPTWELADEILKDAIGGIKSTAENEEEKWKQIFFLYWRRWLDEVVKIKKENHIARHFAYFPADTRIPDHTIWSHMAVTSALQGCRNKEEKIKPAFLLFNFGPVQEFIAQARSTRDLWSGSYMISWLTAHAMKAVTDYNGPDSIIFPSLRGQGIFDVLYRNELYSKITYKGQYDKEDTLWKRMYADGNDEEQKKSAEKLLNPTIPNRFLAIVPADKAEEIAQAAEKAVKNELENISQIVWTEFLSLTDNTALKDNTDNWKIRWNKQIEMFPQISWQVLPWYDNIQEAMSKFKKLPVNLKNKAETPFRDLAELYRFITETIPKEDRDSRYYTDSGKNKLNNLGFVWSVHYAVCDYLLSSRRNTREFHRFITDSNQYGTKKDTLSGKEEVIGDEEVWKFLHKEQSDIFKTESNSYGALNIIKRLWWRKQTGYLLEKLNISESIFKDVMKFESVPDISDKNEDKSPYVAVIALDGDEMGKWISGVKIPKLLSLVGDKAKGYFKKYEFKEMVRRPLTPSYHLQFSEALANFANHLAGKVVEHYKGQLIYAGGDDVLAMLPADKAINCARSLRAVFRGDSKNLPELECNYQLAINHEGFVSVGDDMEYLVPGPGAEVSCGIAIGHNQHPLQHIVEEARKAEKRAKSGIRQSCVCRFPT